MGEVYRAKDTRLDRTVAPWRRLGQSQSQAIASARQIACILVGPTVPTKRASSLCLTVKTLQRLTQDVVFKPSSTPTATSVGAPRSVDVMAATVTV